MDAEFAESAEGRLLAVLSRRANLGLPCPTMPQLAAEAGIGDGNAGTYRFGKLLALGKIREVKMAEGRVVTIVATGARTAAPGGRA